MKAETGNRDIDWKIEQICEHAQWSDELGELEMYCNICFTEPVCPSCVIRYEFSNSVRYLAHADTLLEAIGKSVDHAYREIVKGELLGHAPPFSNSDDRK